MGVQGLRCMVTGGSGFVGQRLVEMLIEKGAEKVISLDISFPKPIARSLFTPALDIASHPKVEVVVGDITDVVLLQNICKNNDCVWHLAALVGPFHSSEACTKVNYEGTLNVINACKLNGVSRIIMSSSPSTRFDGSDIEGFSEDELFIRPPGKFLQAYAETKAQGELAMRAANCDVLMTVCVAPHQVYGPGDYLFLPNILKAAKSGKLRVFGSGKNLVSFTHVDNYCHALLLAYDALYEGSPALGNFYIVTDGPAIPFWSAIDQACVKMGYPSIQKKMHLPLLLLYIFSYVLSMIGWFTNRKFRLSPFTVRMLSIHRWFDISKARRELNYQPIVTFEEGWNSTLDWFKSNETLWGDKLAPSFSLCPKIKSSREKKN